MRRVLVLLLAVLAACAGEDDAAHVPESGPIVAPAGFAQVRLPSIAPSVVTPPAADPKLPGFDGWPLVFDARFHDVDGRTCAVTLSRDGEPVRTLEPASSLDACVATWDGRDASGGWLAPGPVDVRAQVLDASGAELAAADARVEVVRLGIERIQLSGEGRTGLLYRAVGGVREGYYEMAADRFPWRLSADVGETAGASALELADGTPRELPPPWDDLTTPPMDSGSPTGIEVDTYNLPTAFVAGSLVDVTATLSADVAGVPGGGEPMETDVRIVPPDGTEAPGDTAFTDGGMVTVRSGSSPVPAVGRYDWTLTWTFEARRPGGDWVAVPGSLETVHRLYGLVAAPIFDYTAVPHRAWVDVVDAVATWVDGATADPDEVAAALVSGVYYDLGLRYDRERGASFYTSYPTGWTGARFDLSAFQLRANGSTINCSDAGSILSTYANMVGIDFRYHILQHEWASGFDLNYIQAIGWEGFTETPFFSGRGAFRYHAVVGPPDGRIFDATLALDGDGTPTALPATLLLVQGLSETDYLRGLSSEWMNVEATVDEKVRVR